MVSRSLSLSPVHQWVLLERPLGALGGMHLPLWVTEAQSLQSCLGTLSMAQVCVRVGIEGRNSSVGVRAL